MIACSAWGSCWRRSSIDATSWLSLGIVPSSTSLKRSFAVVTPPPTELVLMMSFTAWMNWALFASSAATSAARIVLSASVWSLFL